MLLVPRKKEVLILTNNMDDSLHPENIIQPKMFIFQSLRNLSNADRKHRVKTAKGGISST